MWLKWVFTSRPPPPWLTILCSLAVILCVQYYISWSSDILPHISPVKTGTTTVAKKSANFTFWLSDPVKSGSICCCWSGSLYQIFSARRLSMHVCAVRSSTVIRRCMAAWRWCGGPSTRKMDVLIFCGKEKKTSENSFSLVKYNNILVCLS